MILCGRYRLRPSRRAESNESIHHFERDLSAKHDLRVGESLKARRRPTAQYYEELLRNSG